MQLDEKENADIFDWMYLNTKFKALKKQLKLMLVEKMNEVIQLVTNDSTRTRS
jgi:hypothetical protein